jgi:iron complex transport system permease protein
MLCALTVLAVAVLLGIGIGPAGWSWNVGNNILWNVRMPRVALAALVGAMLSLSGATYQGVFRNPLVDPYLLGVAAGAGLGATAVFAFGVTRFEGWAISPVPIASFIGGTLAVSITYGVGTRVGVGDGGSTGLVLAGVAVGSLFTALQTFVLQRNTEVIREVYSWILGRFNTASWADSRLVMPYVVVSAIILLMHGRQIDVMRVGDDEAQTLGLNVRQTRLLLVFAATLGTAAAVSVSGLIGFVGIVVPHIVRLVAGTSYRRILPLSLLFGAAFMILADLIGRTVLRPQELPIGVVTAFIGAPFFLAVLVRSKRAGI